MTKVEKVKAKTQQDYKESIIEYEYLSWITKRKIGNWEHEKIARVKCGDVLNHWRRKRVSRGPETWTQLRFSACSSSIDSTPRVLVVLSEYSPSGPNWMGCKIQDVHQHADHFWDCADSSPDLQLIRVTLPDFVMMLRSALDFLHKYFIIPKLVW